MKMMYRCFIWKTLLQVTLTVDGIYMEQWKTSGIFSVLASNTVFLGGSEAAISNPLPQSTTNINLVGCMRKVNIDNNRSPPARRRNCNILKVVLKKACHEIWHHWCMKFINHQPYLDILPLYVVRHAAIAPFWRKKGKSLFNFGSLIRIMPASWHAFSKMI